MLTVTDGSQVEPLIKIGTDFKIEKIRRMIAMNYQVQLNNGQVINLKNAEFDAGVFTTTLNDQKINFVNIGGAIINKHTIISDLPVDDTETQAEA